MKKALIEKLSDSSAIIGVAGLGYVGLPLSLCFSSSGYKVIGFDVDPSKVASITAGKTYIKHIPDADIQNAVAEGFEASTDFTRATDTDALIIC
ncbi:MAG: NAD(P)-binding domain-containing protein, partial [Gammaproteobacteria bacterium]